jgi:YbgC/YbaW family acyl-CoA thioester hydrolase
MSEAERGTGGGREGGLVVEWSTRVRSYELDSFGHVNHAVHLNWFEQARFETIEAAGFAPATLAEKGWGIHVVRVEVDYRREARLGEEMLITTTVERVRNSSMALTQVAHCQPGREVVAEARVVLVWIGPDRAPMRIPDEVRRRLGG